MAESEIYIRSATIWEKSKNYEEVIKYLRLHEISKVDTIVVIRNVCRVSLGEAKRIVNASLTWADTVTATAEFHEMVEKALEEE
jgi:ribosomal protein L7/L12